MGLVRPKPWDGLWLNVKSPAIVPIRRFTFTIRRFTVTIRWEADKAQTAGLRPGAKVRHKKFGIGTVISLGTPENRNITTIAFDGAGIKKLDLSYLPVELID